ncbi:MAG: TIGR04283 family arsenosugar biosynthesis glycosyltransferase [Desulfotalea sp.]
MTSIISVIVVTLNEEEVLARTLNSIKCDESIELIVVDGGSSDASIDIAKEHGAKIISAPRGRGIQLNRGAKASTGDILLFLHADTILPSDFNYLIRKAVAQKGCVAGAFSLGIDCNHFGLFIISYLANIRSRLFSMPYGDQGIFIPKSLFTELKGFPEVPIMEDYIFIKNAQKNGNIVTLSEKVFTSPRRWQNMGIIRTTILNQAIVIGYKCGTKLTTLSKWYQRLKGVKSSANGS